MSTVFSLLALPVAPLWLMMVFAPRAAFTRRVLASPWCVIPVAIAYAVMVVPAIPELLPLLLQPQLPEIAAPLGTERGATIAWA